uniref:EF-hand domain-containing protein n=1 Tax=Mola mola TaxID=94237 RepID=A0A3Q3VLW0_MOLML
EEDEQHRQQTPEVPAKVKSAFEAFDYQSNNTVDIREIGTIIYSLGCFPSQADVHEFVAEVEEGQTGVVHFNKFLPAMTKPEDINCCFQVLDKEKKGYLESEELTKYMTQEGEVLSQEEMEEMLTALADREDNRIYYKDLIRQLTVEPDM